jgi:hypothetical protein
MDTNFLENQTTTDCTDNTDVLESALRRRLLFAKDAKDTQKLGSDD